MATLRTLIPPRRNDAWSFSGNGRWLYQRATLVPKIGPPPEDVPPGYQPDAFHPDAFVPPVVVQPDLTVENAEVRPIEPPREGAPVPLRG